VTFVVPDVEITLPDEELAPIIAELEAFDSTRLADGSRLLIDSLRARRPIDIQKIEFASFWALLRALDHVRNARDLGREAVRLRDALVAGWIAYRLRPFTGGEELDFTSYAGMYVPADRLVRSPGEAYRVLDVVFDEDEPTVLLVGDWFESLAG
jgi:hypothetical protein